MLSAVKMALQAMRCKPAMAWIVRHLRLSFGKRGVWADFVNAKRICRDAVVQIDQRNWDEGLWCASPRGPEQTSRGLAASDVACAGRTVEKMCWTHLCNLCVGSVKLSPQTQRNLHCGFVPLLLTDFACQYVITWVLVRYQSLQSSKKLVPRCCVSSWFPSFASVDETLTTPLVQEVFCRTTHVSTLGVSYSLGVCGMACGSFS